MRRLCSGGFTLVELLVVIAIIVMLLGLLGPTGGGSREAARSNICRNNLMQLQKAIVKREMAHGELPGYINTLSDPEKQQIRASWVVTTFPYIEQSKLWGAWSLGKSDFEAIEVLICPTDPPEEPGVADLSYVANAGYIGNTDGFENRANGVFFDRTRTAAGASGPEDKRDLAAAPLIKMTSKYLQAHDGTAHTLLLTENIQSHHWGYTTKEGQENTRDQKYHFGFCWEQPGTVVAATENDSPEKFRRINGNLDYEKYTSFEQMGPNDGFPSSNHPGGVNVAFAGGNVAFISDQIDPLVYAQLMTSNYKKSDLIDASGKAESDIEQPADSDY